MTQKWAESRRSPREWLEIALTSRLAEERRRAVEAIASGGAAREAWAVEAFESIARSDADELVRAAAVRGLRRSAGPDRVPLLVELLAAESEPRTRRFDGACHRQEAATLLRDVAADHELVDPARGTALETLIARAGSDPDRVVRMAALEGLGWIRDARAIPPLVEALRTRDFGMQAAAETSLHRLTGQSHHYDADAWSRWLAENNDPLAGGSNARRRPNDAWSRMWSRS